MGNGITIYQCFRMIDGATNPGRPFANLYVGVSISFSHVFFYQFSIWRHGVVDASIELASDIKLGQYLKVCLCLGKEFPEVLIVP